MSKGVKILFTGSVLLNLVLVGVLIGTFPKKERPLFPFSKEMRTELSPEGQHIVAKEFQNMRAAPKDHFDAFRQARKELKKIIITEPFDEEAYQGAYQKIEDLKSEMRQKKAQLSKDIVKQLSYEDRKIFAENMMRKPHEIHKRKHNREKRDGQDSARDD
jgi:uncharacterized membrane protein